MKYIYYILFIAIAISTVTAFNFMGGAGSKITDPAIIVNDRIISQTELSDRLNAEKGVSHQTNDQEIIESIIIRELLIQEARKQGIDKEESFRKSIQNFYEQSLTKILLDRQYNSLNVKASKEEKELYLEYCSKYFHITLFLVNEEGSFNEKDGINMKGNFQNFASNVRIALLQLKPGQTSHPIDMFDQKYVVRVVKIDDQDDAKVNISEEEACLIIEENKRESVLENWIKELRENANVQLKIEI